MEKLRCSGEQFLYSYILNFHRKIHSVDAARGSETLIGSIAVVSYFTGGFQPDFNSDLVTERTQ